MKLIQKSIATQETITENKNQSWFSKFLGIPPETYERYSGRIIYSDCIIQSEVELKICDKFTHIFDNETYHGITPLKRIPGTDKYLCAVRHIEENVQAKS